MINLGNNTLCNQGRGAYDTTGVPKPPPRPKPRRKPIVNGSLTRGAEPNTRRWFCSGN
jgi:hypothetical protein